LSAVRIGIVFPDLLGTYGDRGNAHVLCDRARRRGIDAEVVVVRAGEPVPSALDYYVIGGGEDHTEAVAAELLRASPVAGAWHAGSGIVAVCAGFQLLGSRLELSDGTAVDGIGLLDAVTVAGPARRVGDVVVDTDRDDIGAICGFENHLGVTDVSGDVAPLGRVRRDGRVEGVLGARLLATYLHGPVLVRNPRLADHVLGWTVGALPALDDDAATLHDALVARFGRPRRRRLFARRAFEAPDAARS
jgi:CobQ-like glutamine amidotransferase family enzyme